MPRCRGACCTLGRVIVRRHLSWLPLSDARSIAWQAWSAGSVVLVRAGAAKAAYLSALSGAEPKTFVNFSTGVGGLCSGSCELTALGRSVRRPLLTCGRKFGYAFRNRSVMIFVRATMQEHGGNRYRTPGRAWLLAQDGGPSVPRGP
ncbi:hypothetical protein trd_A0064 (plasmid) [Thermomicrobium roseum DSM 5159]|uniref:Uncharacterized protein n=1 Tax=Thermomicrobium roseum (strain ATCC 27502 / DSM 5159 / P-2) TaxID=309801 RepID=B9L5D7_THERP|nr:hypothetical protein trd_A0064 [Thermomicrobium roseum DSM 5159]